MTKTLTVMTAGFLMFGIAGHGVHTAHAQSTPDAQGTQLAPPPSPPQVQTDACPKGQYLVMYADGTLGCQSGPDDGAAPPPPQTIDARVGGSLSQEALTLAACIEALFVGPFSAQVCGSGRGLLLDKPDRTPELTHYRVRLRLARASRGRLWLMPIVQAGVTELRAGTIDAGHLPGRGSSRELALGPGAGAALQLLWPLGKGLELVGDIHLEAAWIPRADALVLPQEKLQPSLGATLGIGF
jgi:hypothetical protein